MNRFVFLLMVLIGIKSVYSAEMTDCVYRAAATQENPHPELTLHKNCGVVLNRKFHLNKAHIKQLAFDSHGLSTIYANSRYYYVKTDGTLLAVISFDNWADAFSEGLTRSLVDGKIAYYDRGFNQIIAPKYDWGWPFKEGRAMVCKGCKALVADGDGHTALTGGVWGYINKKGREIVPVRFTFEEAVRKFQPAPESENDDK